MRPVLLILVLVLTTAMANAQPQAVDKVPEFKIEPTFEDIGEMTFAGVTAYAGPASPRFPELWREGFHEVMGDTRDGKGAALGLETEKYAYGLELFPPSFEEKRRFTYMACFSVLDARKVPLHLVQRTVPAAKFAVFKVPGGLDGLGETFGFIYGRWLPASKFERAYPFDMERYAIGPGMEKDGKLSIEVLVPVVGRK